MGMFDHVNVKIDCPDCGTPIKDFQSKDFNCLLQLIDPGYVRHFYSACGNCKRWIDFKRYEEAEIISARETPFTLEEVKALGFELLPKVGPFHIDIPKTPDESVE